LQTYELKLELRLPVRLIRKEMSLIALEVTGEEVKFSLWEILRTTAMRGGVASDTQGLPSGVILFVGGDFGHLFGGFCDAPLPPPHSFKAAAGPTKRPCKLSPEVRGVESEA